MKQTLSMLVVTGLLLCALTACGGDSDSGGTSSGGADDAAKGIVDGAQQSPVTGELKEDPATGTRYTGKENERVVRYGNGYGNTNADKSATTKNATPNATLHGSYNAPTGTPAGKTMAETAADLRYWQMLDNAHVRDTDGFLLDGENASHNTFR